MKQTYPCSQCNTDEGSPVCLQDHRCPSREITCAGSDDPLYEQAVKLMMEKPGIACISRIQRRLAIGWNRASRLMDAMIERGVIARTYSLGAGVEYTVLSDRR